MIVELIQWRRRDL